MERGACSLYQKIPGDKNSLGNNDIQFVFRDSKNRMWLATSGGGFCLAMGNQAFSITAIQELHYKGLACRNDYVTELCRRWASNLWLATENGLSKFDVEQMIFRNYDSYDGLPRVSFSEAAVVRRSPNGQLIFGSTKGSIALWSGSPQYDRHSRQHRLHQFADQ